MNELYQHAADLGLSVEWACGLPARLHGHYVDADRTVYLNYYCTAAQALAALAHEIGHAEYGDRCSTPSIERRADEFGAGLVLSSTEYARAEELVGEHPGALARELGVTVKLIHAWRRWYARRIA